MEQKKLKEVLDNAQKEQTEFAETHDWDKEPILLGVIAEHKFDVETKDGKSDCMVVKYNDTESCTMWLSHVLKNKVEMLGVKVGDTIAVRFEGKKASTKNKGRTYRDFTMAIIEKSKNDKGGE